MPAIYVYAYRSAGSYLISNNTLLNNKATYAILVETSPDYETLSVSIYNNTLINNTATEDQRATIKVTGSYKTVMKCNVLSNPSNQYEFHSAVSNSGGKRFDISPNYWGFITDADVLRRIYDYRDSSGLGPTTYFPFLTSSSW